MPALFSWLWQYVCMLAASTAVGLMGIAFFASGLLVIHVEDFRVGFLICAAGFIVAVPYLFYTLSHDTVRARKAIRSKKDLVKFERIVGSLKANDEFTSLLLHIELELAHHLASEESVSSAKTATMTEEETEEEYDLQEESAANDLIKDLLKACLIVAAGVLLVTLLLALSMLTLQLLSGIIGIDL